jgi:threonine/homoserine/homoserine lactone efflux protein
VELISFLGSVFIISFTGAMQPGPVTATAITMGSRRKWAGVLLAIGHGIVEFPLMILMMIGLGIIFKSNIAQIVIGFIGGVVLILMAIQTFISSRTSTYTQASEYSDKPILTGIILSVSNPYFFIWWSTVGLALATEAKGFGIWAFAIFAVVHWTVDLIWVTALSFTSFHGSVLLGPKPLRIVLMICSVALFGFGLFFIHNAARILLQ